MSILMDKKFILILITISSVAFFSYFIYQYMHSSSATEPTTPFEKIVEQSKDLLDTNEPTNTPTPIKKLLNQRVTPTPTGSSGTSSSSSSSSSSTSSSSSSSSSSSTPTATPTPTVNPCASLSSHTSYDTVILDDSPVLYLPFTESASACDHSTNKYNGTKTGNLPTTTLPNGDTALVFNGVDSYVTVDDRDALSPSTTGKITVEAWMRPDTLQFDNYEGSGYVHWMGKGTTNNQEYLSRMYNFTNSENRPNRISGYAFNASGGLGVGSYFQDSLTAGNWIYYAFVINTVDTNDTYPSGYTKIYKNGSQRDQDTLATLSIVPTNGSAPFRVGTRDFNSFFEGAIGKVAIYNYELTPFQILEHYQTMIPVVAGTANFEQNVGKVSTKTAGTSMQMTVQNQVPSGDTVIVRVAHDYAASAPTITDSRGNTYTRDRTAPNSGNTIRASIFSSPITTTLQAGDTITITTPNVAAKAAVADHFSGLYTSSIVDQQNGSSGSSTTPGTSISITTTHPNALIIGFTGVEGPLEDVFTEDALGQFESLPREGTDEGTENTNVTVNGGYKSVSVTSTYQYKPTLDPTRNWINFIVAYKAL